MCFSEKYAIQENKSDNLLETLLLNRGLDPEDAWDFLHPKWENQHDPFEMLNMDKVVERIWQAIAQEEKVVVYSDYDADGIPGAVILTDFFKKIAFENYEVYIPNRNTEGFGLNARACEGFIENEVALLITIDCGISNLREVGLLSARGVEVIVTDHHLPASEGLPECLILNPNQGPCAYPCKDLCGSGVVFKLVQALLQRPPTSLEGSLAEKLQGIPEGWSKWLLDMVGIATICDMVPLVGENRIFSYYGLKVLHKSRRSGLQKLLQLGRLNQSMLTAQDLAFTIGPRINAASRIAEPSIAFRALSDSGAEGVRAAEELEDLNRRRKTIVAQAAKKAYAKIDAAPESEVIVVGDPNWPLGIVGLIAGNIAERYKKPAFVWTRVGDLYKGSVRSGCTTSMHLLMENCSETFESFGGHAAAGGFVCTADHIHKLSECLSEAYQSIPQKEREKTAVEAIISIDEVHSENWNIITSLEPYGMANPRPLFVLQNIPVHMVRTFGSDSEHVSLSFRQSKGSLIQAIRFNFSGLGIKKPHVGDSLDLVVSFEMNTYHGASELRVRIEDIYRF